MDDFGTGYSSLSYLRALPVRQDQDRPVLRPAISPLPADSGAIVRAIHTLAGSLSMRTTAEGVESYEQLQWLREEGCDEAQGYYLSRPVAADEIPALIAQLRGAAHAAA